MQSREMFIECQNNLQSLFGELSEASREHPDAYQRYRTVIDEFIKQCKGLLQEMPGLDKQIYVHVVGVPKALKTSYVIDLFGKSAELIQILNVEERDSLDEHTACPCLITLTDGPTKLEKIEPLVSKEVSVDEFHRLYQVPKERSTVKGGYLLKVSLSRTSAGANAPTFPVIEYPGVEHSDEAKDQQKGMHEVFRRDMIETMKDYPGIVVACFVTNVNLPVGHPLTEYKNFLATHNSAIRPPLVLSLNGATAVSGYCGKTNVLESIGNYKAFEQFTLKIQLINPNPHNIDRHRLRDFPSAGPHVVEWIKKYSDYADVGDIHKQIKEDGGIGFSKQMLTKMTQSSDIRDVVDRIYLSPWLNKAKPLVSQGRDLIEKVKSYDHHLEVEKYILNKVAKNNYKTTDQLYEERKAKRPSSPSNSEKYQQDIKDFWITLVMDYFKQFSAKDEEGSVQEDDGKCRNIVIAIIEGLLEKINDGSRSWYFLYASDSDKDADFIMLNLLRFHLSARIMRGNKDFIGC
jgi:hypothetical protein